MFIVSITYKVSLSEIDNYLSKHVDYLNKYFESGIFLMAGRKRPRDGGIILAKIEDKKKLMTILDEDPFKVLNLADYSIQEFIPSRVADSLRHLQEN